MRKYATFSGRASRSEFWWFALFAILVIWLANFADPTVGIIASLLLFLPSIAAEVRRLHDVGRAGWWILMPIIIAPLGYLIRPELAILALIGYLVILWWLVLPGSDEVNMYGEPLTQQPGSGDAANE